MGTMCRKASAARGAHGQVLVIVALFMIWIVVMVGLVIDGGNAWGKERETQNGADAVAKAGAGVIQMGLTDSSVTDGDVGCAVTGAAAANEVTLVSATYTDHQGFDLDIAVGSCRSGSGIPSGAQGVKAAASQDFDTFLISIIGFGQLTSEADATAIVGAVESVCPAEAGCGVLPVTFPQVGNICDSTASTFEIRMDDGDGTWEQFEVVPEGSPLTTSNMANVPLCDSAPGSVGWLDLGCGNLASHITNPCNDSIPIPAWLHTQSGNPNCCEGQLNAYAGSNVNSAEPEDQVLYVPIHSNTCRSQPADNDPTCPPPAGEWSGRGNNLYYHIPVWAGFKLNQAYTQGGDEECKGAPGAPVLTNPIPAGKVGCLKGWFVDLVVAPGSIIATPISPGDPVLTGVALVE